MSAYTPEPVPNGKKPGEVELVENLAGWRDARRALHGRDSGDRDARILLHDHDFEYEVAVADTGDGPRVVELLIRSPAAPIPITQRDLRRIPLERLAAAVAVYLRGGFMENPEFAWLHFASPEKQQPQKSGPRGYDDDFYREIARLAKDAATARPKISARQHISHNKGVSVHTADKWLKECRKRGFLIPGELRPKRTQ